MCPSDSGEFGRRLAETASLVEHALGEILRHGEKSAGGDPLGRLRAAMRHAVLSGGKRFRPFLLMECARLFGVPLTRSVHIAAAVELLHCYSLVHDDLPAMDDDDIRRGVPTVHKAFDEATAILAGDALLTLAFEVLSRPEAHPAPGIRAELAGVLARASGAGGMVGGQMLDLAAEGLAADEAAVRRIQAMKTGALFAASCEMGGIIGDAPDAARDALRRYGQSLGLVFQIADDLLDAEATPEALGKASGKDGARGKATFVALLGLDGVRRRLDEAVADCQRHLSDLPGDVSLLAAAARFAAERRR